MSNLDNTASVVAAIVRDHIKPEQLELPDGNDVLLLPQGIEAHSLKPFLDEYRRAPERRKGIAYLGDLDSFIAHAKRFADEDSALFADPSATNPSLTAVLDYHRIGSDGAPRFGQHRGVYSFPLSDEWQAWQKSNGKAMGQAEFAEFVENRVTDLADPSGAGESALALAEAIGATFASPSKLLELSRGLSLRVGARVQNATNLTTGEVQMQFVTEHQDERGAPLKVPGAFLVALPVFRSGALYQLAARLRYRLRDGVVSWFYELHRSDRVFEHAFKEACDLAQKETNLPLFVGAPE